MAHGLTRAHPGVTDGAELAGAPMRVAVRVDACEQTGTGHLTRCLTLADAAAARGARVRFVSRALSEHLCRAVRSRGHELVLLRAQDAPGVPGDLAHSHWLGTTQDADAGHTLEALGDVAWDWVVVDHYALDARWERAVRRVTRSMFAVDDLADRQHDCDLLLDQNLYSDMHRRYERRVPGDCELLLGPRFALLRPEFRRLREGLRPRCGPVERLLVFFGGVDAANHTAHALEALAAGSAPPHVDVIIGATHPARGTIEAICAQRGYACHVQTQRMGELLAAADLVLGGGGVTLWERCCVGVPALAFAVSDNQVRQVADAARAGLVCAPAWPQGLAAAIAVHARALIENPDSRHALSAAGMKAVDGLGADRVLRRMGCSDIVLRDAVHADSRSLFDWRNHPSIRAVSRSSAELGWETHERWLASVLSDPDRLLLIGERSGRPVGIVRFDITEAESEVSIYVVPGVTAAGTGSELLRAAERRLASVRPQVRTLRAEVLGDNERSRRLFSAGGYRIDSTTFSKRLN